MAEITSTTTEMCEYNCIAQQSPCFLFGVWKFETVYKGNLTRSDLKEETNVIPRMIANLDTDITPVVVLPPVYRSEHSLLPVGNFSYICFSVPKEIQMDMDFLSQLFNVQSWFVRVHQAWPAPTHNTTSLRS